MNVATIVVLLFAVASGVALLTRWLRVPYTVALVVAGLVLGRTHVFGAPRLTQELLYAVFLPGLLFEAAFHLHARRFWQNKIAVTALAFPGIAVAIAVTTLALAQASRAFGFTVPLGWQTALVFAALVSPTDPLAVIAAFRRLGVPPRLEAIVEGESLLNDGTAVVFYMLAVRVATGGHAGFLSSVLDFVRLVGLGALLGAAVGFAASLIIARIDEPLIEITLTTLAAYGSFVAAEQVHVSGVLATVAAGMLCGSYGAPRGMSLATRVAVESFWEYVAFALNSIVFLLIGFEVSVRRLLVSWGATLVAFAIVVVVRAGVVLGSVAVLRPTRERMPWRWGVVLSWAGMRGALSMVLALALPRDFAGRPAVIAVTFGVVLLSIVVQGLGIGPLLRWLRVRSESTEEEAPAGPVDPRELRAARAHLLAVQRSEAARAFEHGAIGRAVYDALLREANERTDRLRRGGPESG